MLFLVFSWMCDTIFCFAVSTLCVSYLISLPVSFFFCVCVCVSGFQLSVSRHFSAVEPQLAIVFVSVGAFATISFLGDRSFLFFFLLAHTFDRALNQSAMAVGECSQQPGCQPEHCAAPGPRHNLNAVTAAHGCQRVACRLRGSACTVSPHATTGVKRRWTGHRRFKLPIISSCVVLLAAPRRLLSGFNIDRSCSILYFFFFLLPPPLSLCLATHVLHPSTND